MALGERADFGWNSLLCLWDIMPPPSHPIPFDRGEILVESSLIFKGRGLSLQQNFLDARTSHLPVIFGRDP
jgi:hypothetical protein